MHPACFLVPIERISGVQPVRPFIQISESDIGVWEILFHECLEIISGFDAFASFLCVFYEINTVEDNIWMVAYQNVDSFKAIDSVTNIVFCA